MADTPQGTLEELLAAIQGYDDPRRASAEWKRVYAALQKTGLDMHRFQSIVGMRDVAGLATLIGKLGEPEADAAGESDIDAETLKRAFRAFRKRAKFTQLDDESKLGRGPFSKGGDKALATIAPPAEWPEEVWAELVRQGKLRYVGDGMYRLP